MEKCRRCSLPSWAGPTRPSPRSALSCGPVHPSIPQAVCGAGPDGHRRPVHGAAGRQQDFGLVGDGPYAAVLSLYDRSVCGFPSEEEDARSLRHLAGLLEPGGWLVFGINDWPADLPRASERRGETGEGIERVEVIPDPAAMTCTHRVTLVRPDGGREVHALTRRHYSLPELRRLLAGERIRPARRLPPPRRGAPLRGRRRGPVRLRAARLRARARRDPSRGHGISCRPAPRG